VCAVAKQRARWKQVCKRAAYDAVHQRLTLFNKQKATRPPSQPFKLRGFGGFFFSRWLSWVMALRRLYQLNINF